MNDSIIAQRIQARMRELRINARKLAERSKVGKSFVYDVLSGKSRNPTSSKLALIAKELGVSISYLVGENEVNINVQNYVLGYSLLEDNSTFPQILLAKSHFDFSKKDSLRIFRMTDNSMAPSLHECDLAIIDTSDNRGIPSGIFALKYKGTFVIRKLQHIMGSNRIKITPENKEFSSYEESINILDIIGKVKYFFKAV